jgi:hypothetical protein
MTLTRSRIVTTAVAFHLGMTSSLPRYIPNEPPGSGAGSSRSKKNHMTYLRLTIHSIILGDKPFPPRSFVCFPACSSRSDHAFGICLLFRESL